MKKLIFLFTLLTLSCSIFAQYTGNKLPSGLTVATTVDSADYTIIQKNGENIVKAIRMDTLKTFFSAAIIESIQSLDSVSGSTGQFIISDGSGWLAPASAKYEGNDAYTFGYRTGSVGAYSFLTSGRAALPNTASGQWSVSIGGYGTIAAGTPSVSILGSNVTGNTSTGINYSTVSGNKSVGINYSTVGGNYSMALNGGNADADSSVAILGGVSKYPLSVAIGGTTNAHSSFTIGDHVMTNSFNEYVVGAYNDTIAGGSKTAWVDTDRLFVVGNGQSGARSNALVMLKNGNTTFSGNITADTITGYMPSSSTFGEIWVADGATPQSIAAGTTYVKMTGFVRTGYYQNCTPDSTNDKITITETGYYLVDVSMSSISGTNGVVSRTTVFLGGVEQDRVHAMQTISNTASPNPVGFAGLIKVETVPVDLDVRRRHDNVGAVNFTVVYGNLSIHKIGSL